MPSVKGLGAPAGSSKRVLPVMQNTRDYSTVVKSTPVRLDSTYVSGKLRTSAAPRMMLVPPSDFGEYQRLLKLEKGGDTKPPYGNKYSQLATSTGAFGFSWYEIPSGPKVPAPQQST